MYYDKEFNDLYEKYLPQYVIACELKNIANELHRSNELMLKSLPTHMTMGTEGITVHYGVEELKGEN